MIKVNGNHPVNIELTGIQFSIFNNQLKEPGAMIHFVLTEDQAYELRNKLNATLMPKPTYIPPWLKPPIKFSNEIKEIRKDPVVVRRALQVADEIAEDDIAKQSAKFWKSMK